MENNMIDELLQKKIDSFLEGDGIRLLDLKILTKTVDEHIKNHEKEHEFIISNYNEIKNKLNKIFENIIREEIVFGGGTYFLNEEYFTDKCIEIAIEFAKFYFIKALQLGEDEHPDDTDTVVIAIFNEFIKQRDEDKNK